MNSARSVESVIWAKPIMLVGPWPVTRPISYWALVFLASIFWALAHFGSVTVLGLGPFMDRYRLGLGPFRVHYSFIPWPI